MQNYIYSNNVIEFAAVANESVTFFENALSFKKKDYLSRLSKLLTIIYLKISTLPNLEQVCEEDLEQFVTENDYESVRQSIQTILGETDAYTDYAKTDNQWSDVAEISNATISEDIADIYQDLKDFVMRYQVGNEDVMNDAVFLCKESFREYWGTKLVSALKAIHIALYSDTLTDDDDECDKTENLSNKKSFLHQRITDLQDENNDEWI